jgi:hypothetical protein
MATAMGVLASTGALRTHISQSFSFFLVNLLQIYTCLSNTQIYSTLGGTSHAVASVVVNKRRYNIISHYTDCASAVSIINTDCTVLCCTVRMIDTACI